jgi:hypothetical protein
LSGVGVIASVERGGVIVAPAFGGVWGGGGGPSEVCY